MFTFGNNGNILTQQRYEGSTLVDNLTYQYATNSSSQLLSNRLYSVDDSVTVASLSATDMEDMPTYINASPNTSNNYKYTQIGELKSDNQEEIQEIVWRVDSKISEITRTSGSVKKNLKFEYDAMGNRVAKHVYAGSVLESSTYYVRDAQGNVMGVYEHKMDAENAVLEYRLIERNIYGSAQVGICKDTVDLNITNAAGALTQATYYHARQLNHRQYSLSNHLGNVLTTLGDGKAATDSNSDGVIDYYVAYIISVSDYSPFGVELASRTWSIEEYRNGFQKQESDKELWEGAMYYKYRVEDPRLGRFFSVDPKINRMTSYSAFSFSINNPIEFIELEGGEPFPITGAVSMNITIGLTSSRRLFYDFALAASFKFSTVNAENNISGRMDLNANVYRGGIGNKIGSSNREYSMAISASLNYGWGGKMDVGSNMYNLNYNSKSAFKNYDRNSVSYGLTWSCDTGTETGIGVQRNGVLEVKTNGLMFQTNNDTKYLGGDGADQRYTGGMIVGFDSNRITKNSASLKEYSYLFYQSYTDLPNSIDYLVSEEIEFENDKYTEKAHGRVYVNQDEEMIKWNRAVTGLELNGVRYGVSGQGWFQDAIHYVIGRKHFKYSERELWLSNGNERSNEK